MPTKAHHPESEKPRGDEEPRQHYQKIYESADENMSRRSVSDNSFSPESSDRVDPEEYYQGYNAYDVSDEDSLSSTGNPTSNEEKFDETSTLSYDQTYADHHGS